MSEQSNHEQADSVERADYQTIRSFFDTLSAEEDRWLETTSGYHDLVRSTATSLIPPGQRVLEIGSGRGDLLSSLRPSNGLGVDVSDGMVNQARTRHPELEFVCAAGESMDVREEPFDYVVLVDTVPYVADLQTLFLKVSEMCHARTRLVISSYSNLWRPILATLSLFGLRPNRPVRNWVAPEDLVNLLELAGFQVTTRRSEILAPIKGGRLSRLLNGYVARLPGLRALTATYWLIARRHREQPLRERRLGRNPVPQRGWIDSGSRGPCPRDGHRDGLVFVEGGSSDDTRANRVDHRRTSGPEPDASCAPGRESGTRSRRGSRFDQENLMILDGDITVPAEDGPSSTKPWRRTTAS